MSDLPEIPEPEITDGESLAFSYHPAWGFFGVVVGVLLLVLVAFFEQRSLRDAPGRDIVYCEQGEPIWEDSVPIGVHQVPMSEFPFVADLLEQARATGGSAQDKEVERLIVGSRMEDTESIICVDLPVADLNALLEWGRLPEPGTTEVLAGVYARLKTFSLDEREFTVVGGLSRSARGLDFAYLIPRHDFVESTFFQHEDATQGWIDFSGRPKIEVLENPEELFEGLDVVVSPLQTRPAFVYMTMLGLAIVAFFGMLAHLSVFRILYSARCGPLRPAFRAILTHPRTVIAMHAIGYGTFFVMMFVALKYPVPQMWMNNMIQSEFESGKISYVMDAYKSGNVVLAAWATFWNNYVMQTVLLTVGISLVIPMIGILKTLLSLALVGFGMVPIQAGMSRLHTFHSITMTLELEAYLFACICVAYFWGSFFVGAAKNDLWTHVKRGSRALLSGTLLAGIMLALAGLYEAVTLILARG